MSSQKSFLGLLGVIAVSGLGWIGYRMFFAVPNIPARMAVSEQDTTGFPGYILGSPDAPVEITEYADFQCGACQSFDMLEFPAIKRNLIETGKVRFRYRDLPLDGHPYARLASHAAACAHDQDRFWDVKTGIYLRQPDWSFASRRGAYDILTEVVTTAGLDTDTWQDCMDSAKHAGRIQASYEEAARVGAGSTPTLLIDGRLYPGITARQIGALVDSIIAASDSQP